MSINEDAPLIAITGNKKSGVCFYNKGTSIKFKTIDPNFIGSSFSLIDGCVSRYSMLDGAEIDLNNYRIIIDVTNNVFILKFFNRSRTANQVKNGDGGNYNDI